MKPNIHPQYREVAFTDMSIGKTFIIRSTADARDTVEIDGVTYPQVKLDTSSESHPFYTGAQTRIVEAGRVEKFRQKFAAKSAALNASAEAAGLSLQAALAVCRWWPVKRKPNRQLHGFRFAF